MRKTRRRPILEITQLLTVIAKTPTAVKMHVFMNGLPTFAIYVEVSSVLMQSEWLLFLPGRSTFHMQL